MDLVEIEQASLRAWPALQQEFYDGWMLKFANGYTKRSNSVNSFSPSTTDLSEKITYCEKCYQDKQLIPIFRITPFSSPHDLDDHLRELGYEKINPTLVLTLKLDHFLIQQRSDTELQFMRIHEWFEHFCKFQDENNEKLKTHKEILEIKTPTSPFSKGR
jgi:hypothetical protein